MSNEVIKTASISLCFFIIFIFSFKSIILVFRLKCYNVILTLFAHYICLHAYIDFICLIQIQNTDIYTANQPKKYRDIHFCSYRPALSCTIHLFSLNGLFSIIFQKVWKHILFHSLGRAKIQATINVSFT